MTTIVANLECMAADRFVSYAPSYKGDLKIWTAKGSVWGAAGDAEHCIRFQSWTKGRGARPRVKEPDDPEGARFEALQLSPKGLFLYINDSPPDAVKEPYYAIGSGSGYAIGALSMGATLEQSIEVAAKWDSGTRGPFDSIQLGDAKAKR